MAVLQRSADPEESVRELVAKVFQSLWFATGTTQLSCWTDEHDGFDKIVCISVTGIEVATSYCCWALPQSHV